MRLCFVCVGTTLFDGLIRALDEGENAAKTIAALRANGFTHLTLQIGKGTYKPTNLLRLSAAAPTTASTVNATESKSAAANASGIVVECFDFRPSLNALMDSAALVISHAGAGSILEALRARKPLLVVVNETLMDNHQTELAGAMEKENHLTSATPATVLTKLQVTAARAAAIASAASNPIAAAAAAFKPYPGVNRTAFTALVDDECRG